VVTAEAPVRLPRVVIAAPASGHGKTMLTTGLLAALRRRGIEASGHKVGPDYIDPGYHGAATGRPGRNLDPWLQGEERIVPLLLHGATTPRPADVAVIEGVMGLFDGAIGSGGFASTAHVARLTRTPVVLVVDAAAASRSVGATVLGFATFDPEVKVAGVILNNVATARHEAEARDGVSVAGLPVLGAIPRRPEIVVPSRHLGLVPVVERAQEATAAVEVLAELVGAHVDLDAVLALADTAPDLSGPPWSAREAVSSKAGEAGEAADGGGGGERVRIAVAAGAAFSFLYAETSELLSAAGAEVVTFDPLRDDRLPIGTRGVFIGGGFPEVHATALSANAPLREDIARFAAAGGVIVGECAGLLFLGESLDGHPMCGVLSTRGRFGTRLTLGYRDAVAAADTLLARAGERVTGHEFHRTTVEAPTGAAQAPAWLWRNADGRPHRDGESRGTVHASYLHVHWAGHPHLATRFVSAARRVPAQVRA